MVGMKHIFPKLQDRAEIKEDNYKPDISRALRILNSVKGSGEVTVGELRAILNNLPLDTPVRIGNISGVSNMEWGHITIINGCLVFDSAAGSAVKFGQDLERKMTNEYIMVDRVGWYGHMRFTHHPSGDTCVQKPYMNEIQWLIKLNDFLNKYSLTKDIRDEHQNVLYSSN